MLNKKLSTASNFSSAVSSFIYYFTEFDLRMEQDSAVFVSDWLSSLNSRDVSDYMDLATKLSFFSSFLTFSIFPLKCLLKVEASFLIISTASRSASRSKLIYFSFFISF